MANIEKGIQQRDTAKSDMILIKTMKRTVVKTNKKL